MITGWGAFIEGLARAADGAFAEGINWSVRVSPSAGLPGPWIDLTVYAGDLRYGYKWDAKRAARAAGLGDAVIDREIRIALRALARKGIPMRQGIES
jgi:hypothetical protein